MPLERSFFDQYSVFCVFGSVFGCVVVPLIAQSIESVILSAILISITANHLTRRNHSPNERSYERTIEKRSPHLSKKKKKSNGPNSNNSNNTSNVTSVSSGSNHPTNNNQETSLAQNIDQNENNDDECSPEEPDEILNAMILRLDERRRRKIKKKDKPKRKDPGKEIKAKADNNREVQRQNSSDSSKSFGNMSDRSDQSHSSRNSKVDPTNLNTNILHNKILHPNSRYQTNDNKLNNVEKINNHDSKTVPKANHVHRVTKIETVGHNLNNRPYGSAVVNQCPSTSSTSRLNSDKVPLTPRVSKITYSQCVKGRKGKQLSPYAPEFFPTRSVQSSTIRLRQKNEYDNQPLLSGPDNRSYLPLQCMVQPSLPVNVNSYHNLERISQKCYSNLDSIRSKHTDYKEPNMVNMCKSHIDISDNCAMGNLLQDRNGSDSSQYYSLFGDNHLLDVSVLKLSSK
ncbi:hypothetical protein TrispH2_004857 [Trichoplax sp. H2]|nr:hypothetical protein TrispH2_004857 [Trichoplax sp. H2]|eukprot:RDD42664.1 hypothetical protein TrispH2_004857 [Trichoplax sp. H2]